MSTTTCIKLAGHGDHLPESLWEGNPNMADPSRRPYIPSGYTLILEEPGRRIAGRFGPENRTAFNFALALKGGDYCVFVKTGAGQRQFDLHEGDAAVQVLLAMPSDQRFVMLCCLDQAHNTGLLEGEAVIRSAFLEGRLKKAVSRGIPYAYVAAKTVAA